MELTCVHAAWFAVGDPECVAGAGVPVEPLLVVVELQAARIAMKPAITATAAILTGLAVCDCLNMRTCSPPGAIETSPATGEIAPPSLGVKALQAARYI